MLVLNQRRISGNDPDPNAVLPNIYTQTYIHKQTFPFCRHEYSVVPQISLKAHKSSTSN